VAISTVVIALAQILVGLGMGPAVVQRRSLVSDAASVALWSSLGVATVAYAVLWLAAPAISRFYQVPMVTDVVRVSGLSLFLYGLESIPKALLQRDLKFRKLFWVESAPQVAAVALAIILAWQGAGVWALVAGPLAGAALRACLAWAWSGFRPTLRVDRSVVRPLLGFSVWTLGANLQTWLFLQADNATAGYYLGGTGLGIYSLGFNLSNLFPGLIIPALSAVAYPAFCALAAEPQEVGTSLLQLQSLAVVALLPVAAGLSAIAVPAVHLLYGDRWAGLGEVIALLALMPGLSHLWSLNADAYRAVGRPDVWPKLAAATLVVLLPLLLVAGRYGLGPFTLARFGGHLIYPALNVVAGARILGVPIREQARVFATPAAAVALMYLLVRWLISALSPMEGAIGWGKLAAVVGIGALTYAALLWSLNRTLWHRTIAAGRRVFLGADGAKSKMASIGGRDRFD
jgi:O-antigen/teichoic acid export membrane protein